MFDDGVQVIMREWDDGKLNDESKSAASLNTCGH